MMNLLYSFEGCFDIKVMCNSHLLPLYFAAGNITKSKLNCKYLSCTKQINLLH